MGARHDSDATRKWRGTTVARHSCAWHGGGGRVGRVSVSARDRFGGFGPQLFLMCRSVATAFLVAKRNIIIHL